MKKRLILLIAVLLLLTACTNGGGGSPTQAVNFDDADIIEIGERFFVNEITHIQLNPQQYLGRTVRYEGMFFTEYWAPTSSYFYTVIRHSYGCCGRDGNVGFEVYMGDIPTFPDDTWVEVTGVLEPFEYDGQEMFRLAVQTIAETERGMEFVE